MNELENVELVLVRGGAASSHMFDCGVAGVLGGVAGSVAMGTLGSAFGPAGAAAGATYGAELGFSSALGACMYNAGVTDARRAQR